VCLLPRDGCPAPTLRGLLTLADLKERTPAGWQIRLVRVVGDALRGVARPDADRFRVGVVGAGEADEVDDNDQEDTGEEAAREALGCLLLVLDGFAAPADLNADLSGENPVARVAAFDLLARPFPLAARLTRRRLVMVGGAAHVEPPSGSGAD